MNIKLIDENLLGQPGLSRYIDPKAEWMREIENPDVVIYTDKLCFSQQIDKTKINCAWIIEPPVINGENYINIVKNKDNFRYIFSYIKSIENQIDNFVYIPHGGTWLREEDINIHNKTKLISSIFSWKDWNSYHKLRHRLFEQFKNDERIDFYGTGCNREIEFKILGLKDYMFSIVTENSIESDYFTEKILDCFLSGTIPIYLGSRRILEYFDPEGIIMFDGVEDLPEILNKINENLYFSKLSSIKSNFEKAKQYIHPEKIISNFLEKNA